MPAVPPRTVFDEEKRKQQQRLIWKDVSDTAGLNEITLQRRKQWQEFLQQLKSNPRPAPQPNEAWISIYAYDRSKSF